MAHCLSLLSALFHDADVADGLRAAVALALGPELDLLGSPHWLVRNSATCS